MNLKEEDKKRFWSKVDKTGSCWEWTRGTFWNGYGEFRVDGKGLKAHRVSYSLEIGEIPEGLCVCHTCDNPKCVNPDHLFLATHKENMEDKVRKNRQWKLGHPYKYGKEARKRIVSGIGGYGTRKKICRNYCISRNTLRKYEKEFLDEV